MKIGEYVFVIEFRIRVGILFFLVKIEEEKLVCAISRKLKLGL